MFLIIVPVSLCFLLFSCDKKQTVEPKFDRQLIGEELKFGRKAAKYELWHEAIFRWEKVVAAEGENVKALNNLAVAYEAVGDYEAARVHYEKALDVDEDVTALRNNYKRFLHFYKRHMKNRERLEKKEAALGKNGSAQKEGSLEPDQKKNPEEEKKDE